MTSRNRNLRQTIFIGLPLIAYLFLLFLFLFCKASSFQSVNLIPFHSILSYCTQGGPFALGNLLGNFFLLMPMGVYLALLNPNGSLPKNTVLILLFSVAVEFIQYLFRVGAADIDDVLLNGLGGFVGVLLFCFFEKRLKRQAIRIVGTISWLIGIAFILVLLTLQSGMLGIRIRFL